MKLRVGFITPALYWGGAERWMLDLARLSADRLDWIGVATVESINRDATMASLFEQIMPVYEHGPEAVANLLPIADVLIAWGAYDLKSLTQGFTGPIIFTGHGQGQFDHHAAQSAAPGATHFAAVARAAVPPITAAGVPENAVTVMYNGIDPARCRQTSTRAAVRRELGVRPAEFLVAYVGRLVPEKFPLGVAKAVAMLPGRFRALFVGGGWAEEAERDAIREVLGRRALFTGRVENVGDYYAAADCFAQASPREGFSMGMLEAMHCRLPCALTNVGVLPELEETHGRHWESVVPDRPETAADLSRAIGRIAAMPPPVLADRTRRAAEIVEQHYLATHMADRWIRHLHQVAADWKTEPRRAIVTTPKPPDRDSASLATSNQQLATDCPFERAYVINLRRRPDRKKAFFERLATADWPEGWPEVEVYDAIDGDVVGTPPEFQHGSGAYGCRMSHLRLLQDCLMQGVKSVLVFEDDADLTSGVGPRIAEFCAAAPADWEGLMPGGQHHQTPQPVPDHPGVVRVMNAQRTHCYIARGKYLKGLQERWGNSHQHIDWRMKDFHHRYRVYAPVGPDGKPQWLVGQAGGRSDVYKGQKPPEWWNEPRGPEPLILLHAPRQVMQDLRPHGFHSGMRRNREGLDVGLVEAYAATTPADRKAKLMAWVRCLQQECFGGWITTVWHPQARLDDFRGLVTGKLLEITANSVEEALAQVPPDLMAKLKKSISERQSPVVLLDAPREVLEALRSNGFHSGHWRHESGIDQGLRRIYSGPEDPGLRAEALRKWCKELLTEADRDGQILTAWHPGAVPMGALTAEQLAEASGRRVIEIHARSVAEALRAWEES